LSTHKALANRLAELESKIETHDEAIRSLVSAIRQLMAPPAAGQKKIGFQLREKRASYAYFNSPKSLSSCYSWHYALRLVP
jgi:hypothetical protein